MSVVWHRIKWWDWCMLIDGEKEIEPFLINQK